MIDEKRVEELKADMRKVVEASLEIHEEVDQEVMTQFHTTEEMENKVFSTILNRVKREAEMDQEMDKVMDGLKEQFREMVGMMNGEPVVKTDIDEEILEKAPDCFGHYKEADECVECDFRELCKNNSLGDVEDLLP